MGPSNETEVMDSNQKYFYFLAVSGLSTFFCSLKLSAHSDSGLALGAVTPTCIIHGSHS